MQHFLGVSQFWESRSLGVSGVSGVLEYQTMNCNFAVESPALLELLIKASSPPLLRLVKVESPPLLGLLVKIASPPLLATMEILLAVTSVMPFFQSACMHGSIFQQELPETAKAEQLKDLYSRCDNPRFNYQPVIRPKKAIRYFLHIACQHLTAIKENINITGNLQTKMLHSHSFFLSNHAIFSLKNIFWPRDTLRQMCALYVWWRC